MTAADERAENERQLFNGFWPVYEQYGLAPDGFVGASSLRVKRWSAPIAQTELPQMVAKLQTAPDSAILAFCETYGLLGFWETEWQGVSDLIHALPLVEPRRDPLAWVRAHARTVRVCLELTDALKRKDKATLERLTTDPTTGYAVRNEIGQESAPDLLTVKWPLHLDVDRRSLQTRARWLRAALINPNIRTIHRVVNVRLDGTEQSFFHFHAQIEVVYWHLANVIDGGIVGRCKRPGCGAFFIQRHKSQEYCAPKYAQRESPCALWVRQRRLGQPKTKKRITK